MKITGNFHSLATCSIPLVFDEFPLKSNRTPFSSQSIPLNSHKIPLNSHKNRLSFRLKLAICFLWKSLGASSPAVSSWLWWWRIPTAPQSAAQRPSPWRSRGPMKVCCGGGDHLWMEGVPWRCSYGWRSPMEGVNSFFMKRCVWNEDKDQAKIKFYLDNHQYM